MEEESFPHFMQSTSSDRSIIEYDWKGERENELKSRDCIV